MQVTETSAEGLKREFRIVVPAGELEDKVVSRLDELGRTIRLPGFRPGKVPMQILRRRYGPSVLGRSAGEHGPGQLGRHDPRPQSAPGVAAQGRHRLVQRGRRSRIQDAGRGPARNPGAEFCRSRHRAPRRRGAGGERRRGDRSGSPSSSANRSRSSARRENGDILVVDVEGRGRASEEIPGASGKDRQIVLGSGGFIPGFEEQLIGAAAGEHREVRVTFPEDYAAAATRRQGGGVQRRCEGGAARRAPVASTTSWARRSGSKTSPSCARRCGSRWSAITRWPRACG